MSSFGVAMVFCTKTVFKAVKYNYFYFEQCNIFSGSHKCAFHVVYMFINSSTTSLLYDFRATGTVKSDVGSTFNYFIYYKPSLKKKIKKSKCPLHIGFPFLEPCDVSVQLKLV